MFKIVYFNVHIISFARTISEKNENFGFFLQQIASEIISRTTNSGLTSLPVAQTSYAIGKKNLASETDKFTHRYTRTHAIKWAGARGARRRHRGLRLLLVLNEKKKENGRAFSLVAEKEEKREGKGTHFREERTSRTRAHAHSQCIWACLHTYCPILTPPSLQHIYNGNLPSRK
jgi:hypothetical protein